MGCQLNENDSEKISGMLEKMQYEYIEDYRDADLIVFNTCCVRENAEKKVFGEIGSLKSLKAKNPELIICVCGCMVQQEHIVSTILSKYHQVDLLFGTHNIFKLAELIWKKEPISTEELVKLCILELLWDGAKTQRELRRLCKGRIMKVEDNIVSSLISYEDYCARLEVYQEKRKSEALVGFIGASDRFYGGNDKRWG